MNKRYYTLLQTVSFQLTIHYFVYYDVIGRKSHMDIAILHPLITSFIRWLTPCHCWILLILKASHRRFESWPVQQGPAQIQTMYGQAECIQADQLINLGKTSRSDFT